MSLGAGALKVSGGPNAISRGEVSMATLEAGTTPTAATNRHRHIVQTCVPKNTFLRKYLQNHQAGKEERELESTMICKKAKIDLLRSASKAIMQSNTSKRAYNEPCNSLRVAL